MNQLEIDRSRVKALFDINTLLLHRTMMIELAANPRLNTNNIPPQEISKTIQSLSNPSMNKQELIPQYLKRVQVNLTCVGELNERHKISNFNKPIFPAILIPPPESTPEIKARYLHLTKIFPEAFAPPQQQQQPQPQQNPMGFKPNFNNNQSNISPHQSSNSTPSISSAQPNFYGSNPNTPQLQNPMIRNNMMNNGIW